MGDDYATLFEPLGVVVHSMKFAQVNLGDTVAVFGAGPIGLLTIACLKLAGATRIFAVEPVAERRELARAVGASDAVDPHSVDPRAAIAEATRKRGVDIAIDCVTREGTIDHCLNVVRNVGRVVITGIPPEPQVTLDIHTARRKEIHIYNVRRSNHETDAAVEMMRQHPELFGPIVTHSKPVEQIQAAFEQVEAYAAASARWSSGSTAEAGQPPLQEVKSWDCPGAPRFFGAISDVRGGPEGSLPGYLIPPACRAALTEAAP